MDERELLRQFDRVAEQGREACQQIERGQATTPLSDHFSEIVRSTRERTFSLALLGVTREARTTALSWLYGSDCGLLSVHMPDEVGLLEIHLSDRGFVLETAGGRHREFDRIEPFFEALRSEDLVRADDESSWIDPLRLRVDSTTDVRSLRILMAEGLDAFRQNPQLLGRLTLQTSLLAIVAPETWTPSPEEESVLDDLVDGMEVVWPVVLVEDVDARTAGRGWWNLDPVRAARQRLPEVRIDGHEFETMPAFLTDENDPLRRAMSFSRQAHRLERAVDALEERQEHELRQLRSRKTREERKTASERRAGDSGLRAAQASVKSSLQDELKSLEKGVRENVRKASLPDGTLTRVVEDVLVNLDAGDLRQEAGHSAYKLTVDDELLEHLTLRIKKALKKRLREDLVLLRDGLQAYRETTEREVSDEHGVALSLELPPPDERALWDTLKEMLAVRIRYSGELPRRTFFQRLGEGRRSVFAILMTLSIVGSIVGVNLRQAQWIGGVFIAVFLGSFVWTFRSWKAEDRERLEKEVDRVRDALRSEAERLIAEVEREKASRIKEHLERIQKAASEEIERAFPDHERAVSEAEERARDQARERQRQVDAQIREAQSFQQGLGRLSQSVRDLERACQQALRDLLRDAREAPGGREGPTGDTAS